MDIIWVAFSVAVALVGLIEGARLLLPSILRGSSKAAAKRRERQAKEHEYFNRRQGIQTMVMRRNVLINDRTELETKLLQLEDRHMLLDLDRPALVIELGDARGDNRLFTAGVSNRYAVANRVPPGVFDTPLNMIWARENLVEVWAPSAMEAKILLESAYPKGKGYEIVFHGEASGLEAGGAKP